MATAPTQSSAASPIDTHAAPTTDTRENSGKATAALVLGIIGLLLFFIPLLAWILGGTAIGLALTAKSDIRRRGLGGLGKANAGLILGIIAVVLGIAMFVANMVIAL
jgi:hypothetical protein